MYVRRPNGEGSRGQKVDQERSAANSVRSGRNWCPVFRIKIDVSARASILESITQSILTSFPPQASATAHLRSRGPVGGRRRGRGARRRSSRAAPRRAGRRGSRSAPSRLSFCTRCSLASGGLAARRICHLILNFAGSECRVLCRRPPPGRRIRHGLATRDHGVLHAAIDTLA
jgi:hypothetical protein